MKGLRRIAARLAQAAGWRSDPPDLPGIDWACGVRELVDARQVLARQALEQASLARQRAAGQHTRLVHRGCPLPAVAPIA